MMQRDINTDEKFSWEPIKAPPFFFFVLIDRPPLKKDATLFKMT